MNNKTIKQVTRYFGYTLSFIGVTILAIVVTLISTVYLLCKGPSTKAKELFVTTFLETGQMKFMASLFMDKLEINKIISNNNLSKMDTEIKGELIDISKEQKKDLITIVGTSFQKQVQFKEGMKLKLVKEPDNSYDKDAIAVYVGSDKVGYVANSSKTNFSKSSMASELKNLPKISYARYLTDYFDYHIAKLKWE